MYQCSASPASHHAHFIDGDPEAYRDQVTEQRQPS